jgi:hypothetical protein
VRTPVLLTPTTTKRILLPLGREASFGGIISRALSD